MIAAVTTITTSMEPQSLVETGESVHTIECFAAMNTVAWHPSKYLLAYAGDEQEPRPGGGTAMIGNLRIFGFSG
jgi:THO complex subunit 3